MTFQLRVVHPLRITGSTDGEAIAERFLCDIGYIPPGTGQRLEGGVRSSAGFKLFYHCLLTRPHHSWTAAELTPVVGATPATIYRHLQRLRELGLVAEEAQQRYRFWHHSLIEAWEGVECHARLCQRIYGRLVARIEEQLGGELPLDKPGSESSHEPGGQEPISDYPLAAPPESFNFVLAEVEPLTQDSHPDSRTTAPDREVESLLGRLLMACGYLDSRSGKVASDIPFKLFNDWLLARRDRIWTADELAVALSASRPTIYRHLNRLEQMGWLEKVILKEGHPRITGFRLRGGTLGRAWPLIEDKLELGLLGYRKAINQLVGLAPSA